MDATPAPFEENTPAEDNPSNRTNQNEDPQEDPSEEKNRPWPNNFLINGILILLSGNN